MDEENCYEKDPRERTFRYLIMFSVLISVIAIASQTITLPLLFIYVTSFEQRISSDTIYCHRTLTELQYGFHNIIYVVSDRQSKTEDENAWVINTSCDCCVQGPSGLFGRSGRNGRPGIPGIPGKHGYPTKLQSSCHVPCSICPPGLPGSLGPVGTPGNVGSKGASGISGKPGKDGLPALKGLHGLPGPPGLHGPPGNSGYSTVARPSIPGFPGSPGKAGPIGLPGYPGKDAPNALSGLPGPKGLPGFPGYSESRGPPGVPGPSGQPGIPDQPSICPIYCAIDGGTFYAPPYN